MGTIKSYTDLEQSRKLAEILPLASADMCYIKHSSSDNLIWRFDEELPPMILGRISICEVTTETLPCWSLAALLNVLPTIDDDEFEPQLHRSLDKYRCTYEGEEDSSGLWRVADNPVDACVAMIEELNELKLLQL